MSIQTASLPDVPIAESEALPTRGNDVDSVLARLATTPAEAYERGYIDGHARGVDAERSRWDGAIGAVMPPGFKTWHESPSERPETAAWCITNARESSDLAWLNNEFAAAAERERCAKIVREADKHGCACSDSEELAKLILAA